MLADVDATNTCPFFLFDLDPCRFRSGGAKLWEEEASPSPWYLESCDELGSGSSCDSCGEINRAVGLGPLEEGPLDFFRIG